MTRADKEGMELGLQQLGNVPGRPRGRGRAAGAVAIRTVGLTRVFGRHKAVDSVNLEIKTGEVFGFLGPNGAGKTTTINMILGLIRPTAGRVEILGQKAEWACPALRRHVGSLLDGMRFYPYLSGRDNLRLFAAALGSVAPRRIDEVLELVGLAARATDRVRGYSHGMLRRLGLALALLRDPVVLVLDEPANGLDPAGIKEMRDLMKALAAQGKAVFLSSHLLHEVELICDKVAILRRGVVLAQGRVDELLCAAPALEIAVDRPDEAERILLLEVGVQAGTAASDAATRSGESGKSSSGLGESRLGAGVDGTSARGAECVGETSGERPTPRVRSVRREGERIIVEYEPCNRPGPSLGGAAAPSVGLHGQAGRSGGRGDPEGLFAYRAVASHLNAKLAAHNLFAYEIRPRRAVLEDVFFDVLAEGHEGENDSARAVDDEAGAHGSSGRGGTVSEGERAAGRTRCATARNDMKRGERL